MNVDTFLELPYQEKLNLIHLRDWPVSVYLEGIHRGTIPFDSSDADFDKLWAAEHLDHLLSSCRKSVSRMAQSDSPHFPSKSLKHTANYILSTLTICDQMMVQIGLKPLSELNLSYWVNQR